eukprot:4950740-Prymnesium_polylepis.1
MVSAFTPRRDLWRASTVSAAAPCVLAAQGAHNIATAAAVVASAVRPADRPKASCSTPSTHAAAALCAGGVH